jgi:uncharacterized protein
MNPDNTFLAQTEPFFENILSLVDIMRRAGLPVSSGQVMDFSRALTLVNIGSREQVYHAARCLLVSRQEHLQLFETLFNAFWRIPDTSARARFRQTMPQAPRHQHQPALVSYMANKAHPADPELDVRDKSGTYSDLEIFTHKDFMRMTPEELNAVKHLMQAMKWRAVLRRTRRRIPDRSGDTLHMRRVMSSAIRYGGVPLKLARQSRKIKQRPMILIADISGSMEKYSRLILQFFYGMSHSLKHIECFAFGTRLTRITLQLKLKNIDQAVSQAASEVNDWSGGTRIGESLASFNRQWSRRVLRRGAIVMVVSDGWERGDISNLQKQMRYLQLRCHRLIWLNPLMGRRGYQPLVEGMAAALPYIDDFLPLHNLRSLSELAEHLAAL